MKKTYAELLYGEILKELPENATDQQIQSFVQKRIESLSQTDEGKIVPALEHRFIGPDSPVHVGYFKTPFMKADDAGIKCGFTLDNTSAYEKFIRKLITEKPQIFIDTLDLIDAFQMETLGKSESNQQTVIKTAQSPIDKRVNMRVMPFDKVVSQQVAQCAAKSALVHNCAQIIGIPARRSACTMTSIEDIKNRETDFYHVLNIFKFPETTNVYSRPLSENEDYAVIFDTSFRSGPQKQATAVPISKEIYENFCNGKAIDYIQDYKINRCFFQHECRIIGQRENFLKNENKEGFPFAEI